MMDGLNIIRPNEVTGGHGKNATAGVRRLPSRALTEKYVAAIQVSLLAIGLLCASSIFSREEVSPPFVAFGVLVLSGFAIVNVFWLFRSVADRNLVSLVKEAYQRSIEVAALVLLSAIAVNYLSGTSWSGLNPEKVFILASGIACSGVVVMALGRSASKRRIMVIGTGCARQMAGALQDELPDSGVVFMPLHELDKRASACREIVTTFLADPRFVEHAPNVAIVVGCEGEALHRLLCLLAPLPIDVLLDAPGRGTEETPGAIVSLAQRQFVRIFPQPLSIGDRFAKRTFDLLISSVLLVLTVPLLAVSAVAVAAESRGPIFFRQPRIGLGGRQFTILKFRTMYLRATDLRADVPTVKNDPRVTRVGSFLRRTSIDELPQIFNVVVGNMSLVGPRPHAMNGEAFGSVVSNYQARHRVRPGITGLAQILGWRGLADTPDKIEQRTAHDIQYINRWSLAGDVLIMLRTFLVIFDRNAY